MEAWRQSFQSRFRWSLDSDCFLFTLSFDISHFQFGCISTFQMFRCSKCSHSFSSSRQYLAHKCSAIVNIDSSYSVPRKPSVPLPPVSSISCPLCLAVFTSRPLLASHFRGVHPSDNGFRCFRSSGFGSLPLLSWYLLSSNFPHSWGLHVLCSCRLHCFGFRGE